MATDSQYRYLRDLYAKAIGWSEANRWVQVLRVRDISKSEASKEIERLVNLKTHGQYTGPLDYTKDRVKEEDDPNYNDWWNHPERVKKIVC